MGRCLAVLLLLLTVHWGTADAQTGRYSWSFKGNEYSIDLGFLKAHYSHYRSLSKEQAYTQYLKESPAHSYQWLLAKRLDSLAQLADCSNN